jgi:hypothetical protein
VNAFVKTCLTHVEPDADGWTGLAEDRDQAGCYAKGSEWLENSASHEEVVPASV